MEKILITSPTKVDLGIIKKWLIDEDKILNQGFYCNWNIIEYAFNRGELFTFSFEKEIIGFSVFSEVDKHLKIDIFEIEPSYRQQHLGRFFYTEIENYFKNKGFSAIQLFCSPRESEKFWRKLDFIQFPEVIFSESDLTFYKPLIKTLSPNNKDNFDSVLELWNKEPYQVKEKDMPNWTWGVNEKGELENPIFFSMQL